MALEVVTTQEVARAGNLRLFAAAADEPRARRLGDALILVVSSFALAGISFAERPLPGFSRAVVGLLTSVPGFLDVVWQLAVRLLVVVALTLVVWAALRSRLALVRDLVLAAAIAAVVSAVTGRVVAGEWIALWPSLSRTAEPWYPATHVAVPAAVLVAASPYVIRPVRRIQPWLIGLATLGVAVLGVVSPLGAFAGLLVAWIAAASVHLAFGSSAGRPSLAQVARALAELGVVTGPLGAADRQAAGSFHVETRDADGRALLVKVFGRDAHDAALLTTAWRTVWYRDAGAPLRFGRRNQVEHEAFLTLFARQAGVPTDEVVAASATTDDDALIVLRRTGTELLDDDGRTADEADLRRLWQTVTRLHGAGIAHGQLDGHHVVRAGPGIGLVDFSGGAAAPSDAQRRTDEVQTLVTSALACSVDAAIDAAHDALGAEGLASLLPYVQPSILTGPQRRQVRDHDLDLDDLRSRIATRVGVAAPELQQLRRVTLGSVVRVLLPALALILLISVAGGVDWSQVPELLSEAIWWLVALGFVTAQLPRLTGAVSTLGASPVPLPLGPVYALQLATSYLNVAVPSTAARVAMNIRFFQRHGVPPGTAVATGALDGFAGFLVQATVLFVVIVFTGASLELDFQAAISSTANLLAVVAALVVGVVVVVLAVPRLRRFVVGWVTRLGREAIGALRGLQSPKRLALLLGGSLGTEVLFALSLGVFCLALGAQVSLGELLLVNIGVSLLSGLLPVPGGVGVTEGGLTFGLVSVGVPEEVAFTAVLLQRASTFYLPPVWGFFAMRWLQRNGHL